LFWLIVLRERWNVSYVAYSVVLCTLFMVGISWWVRWRGMQHAWARTRMVAEITRSLLITSNVAPGATSQALRGAPSLEQIARWLEAGRTAPSSSLEQRT